MVKVPVIGTVLVAAPARGVRRAAPSACLGPSPYGWVGPGRHARKSPLFIGEPRPRARQGNRAGLDASMLDDRLGVEYTYYNKKTVDAILNRRIAPSTGIPSTQPFNAGAIRNGATSSQVRANPLRTRTPTRPDVQLRENDNRVLALFDTVSFVNSGSFTRQAIGYDAFGFWERHVTGAKLDANGKLILSTLMCSNGKGGQVQCAGADNAFGTADDAPLVYLGRSVPPHEGSISANLGLWSRFHVSTFVDFKQGHKKIDGNTRVRCTPVIGNRCRENSSRSTTTRSRSRRCRTRTWWISSPTQASRSSAIPVSYDVPGASATTATCRARPSRLGPQPARDQYQGFEPGDVARSARGNVAGADPDPQLCVDPLNLG